MFTTRKYICVSRPRRFGKSLAANMLAAYYSRGCDSRELFRALKLAQCAGWEKNLNQYDVVFLNMQEFLSRSNSVKNMLDILKKSVLWELLEAYPDYRILPIKKYGTHSALNMFSEFSMTNPRQLAEFVGFTEEEATQLCARYGMDLTVLKDWYDGYYFDHTGSVYNPQSVVEALQSGVCDDYWNQTETFDALRTYIDMNFDGLKDDIVSMLSGERVMINTGSFVNDMSTFRVKDDVLTLLIHLGYLGYDFYGKKVFIPNSEIMNEFVTAVQVSDWGEVTRAVMERVC